MDLNWTTESVDCITLVSVCLQNHRSVPRRVRLQNRLDGPVLPPRRQREPEAGWDRSGVSMVVPARSTAARGYACPVPVAKRPGADDEAPVEIVDVRAPKEDGEKPIGEAYVSEGSVNEDSVSKGSVSDDSVSEDNVGKAIRHLGDARPPRTVLGETASPTGGGQSSSEEPPELDTEQPATSANQDVQTGRSQHSSLPPDVDELLTPYRNRIWTVEALTLASVSEATALLDTTGGIAGVERTGTQVDADAAALRVLAAEATALAARAEAATPPLDALRRLL